MWHILVQNRDCIRLIYNVVAPVLSLLQYEQRVQTERALYGGDPVLFLLRLTRLGQQLLVVGWSGGCRERPGLSGCRPSTLLRRPWHRWPCGRSHLCCHGRLCRGLASRGPWCSHRMLHHLTPSLSSSFCQTVTKCLLYLIVCSNSWFIHDHMKYCTNIWFILFNIIVIVLWTR